MNQSKPNKSLAGGAQGEPVKQGGPGVEHKPTRGKLANTADCVGTAGRSQKKHPLAS